MLEVLTLQQWAAICSIIVSLAVMIRPLRKKLISVWNATLGKTQYLLKTHIEAEESTLERIEAQFHLNDGGSMRDAINALSTQLSEISFKQHEFDAFLRAQLNIHNVAIVRTDEKGHLIAVNRHFQRLLGYSEAELLGEGWINAIKPEDRSKIKNLWSNAVAEGREFHEMVNYVRPDGTEITCQANVYRETNPSGEILGYLGVVTPSPLCCDEGCPYVHRL